jgi:hypothetical protein
MDDVVVKTRTPDTLIADLEETFATLREYQWKLNPNKCFFGVPSWMLLGFIISHRGIEANCRAYTPGSHARKEEDGLLLEFPCNSTRTRSV